MRQGIQVSLLWPLMNAAYHYLRTRICSLCGYKKKVGEGTIWQGTECNGFCLLSEAWFKGGGGGSAYAMDPCC